MQMLHVVVGRDRMINARTRQHEEGAGAHINNRGGGDAHLGTDEWALEFVAMHRLDGPLCAEERNLPQGRIAGTVSIEGINGVMLSGDIEHIVPAFVREVEIRNIQRLCVDRTIDLPRAYLAELPRVDVFGRKYLFVEVGAGAQVVILRCGNLSKNRKRKKEEGDGSVAQTKSHVHLPLLGFKPKSTEHGKEQKHRSGIPSRIGSCNSIDFCDKMFVPGFHLR